MRTLDALFYLALLLPGSASAEEVLQAGGAADALVSESIEVRIVNVDVFVSDRRGRPVSGLERADFEVLVDGAAVPIVNFYTAGPAAERPGAGRRGAGRRTGGRRAAGRAPAAEPAAGPAAGSVAEALPLHLAILVDGSNVEARARNEALGEVRELLRSRLGPGDLVMLVSTSRTAALASPQAFTDRLDLVERQLDEIAATPAQDRRAAEFQEILQDIGVTMAASTASVGAGPMEHRSAAGITSTPPVTRAGTKRRKYRLPEKETAAGYRRALRLLAGGEPLAAQEALFQLEAGAAREAVYDQLAKIESKMLARLAKASPGGLLPVALFHADMVPLYRRQGLSPLAEHALRTSIRSASSIARGASSPTDRSAAGEALTELAGLLLRAGRLSEGEALFELALATGDGNAVARLGLGVSHERGGRYEQAAAALEPLVERPGHPEARLRLALNLERLGKTSRSRPMLEALTGLENPDWIAMLAVQETARIAIRERHLDAASQVLRAALERWPSHSGLLIQQAHLRDRSGLPREASDQIARLIAAGVSAGPSPRERYNRWPASENARRELRLAADERLTDLRRALETFSP